MDELKEIEASVRDRAARFDYPETPDLRPAVLARIGRPGAARGWQPWVRAAAVLGLLAAVLIVSAPQARAVLRDAIRLGVVRLLFEGDLEQATEAVQVPGGLAGLETVAGRTSLEQAQRLAPFELHLPGYPDDLGPPDRVYYQDTFGPLVVLVWLAESEAAEVPWLSLHILGEEAALTKLNPTVLTETTVSGSTALWTEGPYLLELVGRGPIRARLVEGRVLIWAEGDVTYRLESGLSLEEARRVAESLGP